MHLYEGYHFWGMHLFWWVIWGALIIWVFASPWSIPGERKKEDDPLKILQRKFIEGIFSTEEYEKRKTVLEKDKVS